jgi:hypothetical protein
VGIAMSTKRAENEIDRKFLEKYPDFLLKMGCEVDHLFVTGVRKPCLMKIIR